MVSARSPQSTPVAVQPAEAIAELMRELKSLLQQAEEASASIGNERAPAQLRRVQALHENLQTAQ